MSHTSCHVHTRDPMPCLSETKSCPICTKDTTTEPDRVISHICKRHHDSVRLTHVTCARELCRIYARNTVSESERVMWYKHKRYAQLSQTASNHTHTHTHICKKYDDRVMSHVHELCHIYIHESCHIYTSYVTYTQVMSHIHES